MTSDEIRAVINVMVDDAKPDGKDEIPYTELKLRALTALMIGEIAAQLAEINERFSPKVNEYGPN